MGACHCERNVNICSMNSITIDCTKYQTHPTHDKAFTIVDKI